MSKTAPIAPVARHWRSIPQEVKPRAMSPEGRRRAVGRWVRGIGSAGVLAGLGWGGWQIASALRSSPSELPPAARTDPVRRIELTTDGVLDQAWLERTLALPKGATLMSLDLERLHARVLASGQVAAAALIRSFPATLRVRLSERAPVARVMVEEEDGVRRTLLVGRDGTVFAGEGYDPAMIGTLPWLDGIRLRRRGAGFEPIAGMGPVADLLAQAKLETAPLYRTWRVVSLARLPSDGEIAVRTADGLTAIFGTQEDFFRQLARLDLVLDTAASKGNAAAVRQVDLSLGSQVPVTLDPAAAGVPVAASPPDRPSF